MPRRPPAVEWIPRNVVIPEETESPGPFDLDKAPHVLGVLEAWDDPEVRVILLPWAARLAKTTTAIACLMYGTATAPRPSLYVNATEPMAADAIESQFYPLIEACPPHAPHLLPPHQRNRRSIQLERARVRVGFSGAPSTLRGFPACYGIASEVSAWSRKKSGDANTLRLFGKRFKLFPFDSKQIFESSPTKRGSCNITDLICARGVQILSRYVPCPHCGTYQLLVFGGRDPEAAGVKWAKASAGAHSDPQLAEETAYYRCVSGCRIDDADRGELLRNGVWLAEGQTITPRRNGKPGTIQGKPKVESSTVAFGTSRPVPGAGTGALSALYSPLISGWGQIAREWLEALDDPTGEAIRDFICSTLGLEYDPAPVKVAPHELGGWLSVPEPMQVCPPWSVFLTRAVDVQENADEFHWQVIAWGAWARGQVIDLGVAYSEQELEQLINRTIYPHADGGRPLKPVRTGIDTGSGAHTETLYAFCRRVAGCLAIKGSSTSDFPDMCRLSDGQNLRKRQQKQVIAAAAAPTGTIVIVNTERSQRWVQAIVERKLAPTGPQGLALPEDLGQDGVFLQQLLNEYAHSATNQRGYEVHQWTKTGPNEQRDLLRYNRAIAELSTNFGRNWPRIARLAPQQKPAGGEPSAKSKAPPRLIERPGGWVQGMELT